MCLVLQLNANVQDIFMRHPVCNNNHNISIHKNEISHHITCTVFVLCSE